MKTVHKPSNFEPQDYEVVDYFDNVPPTFPVGNIEDWRVDKKRLFPDDQDIYKCAHCGNTNVRYIVCVRHIPSGKNVVFGDICERRLGFKNHDDFKSTMIRSKAQQELKRIKLSKEADKLLESHIDFAESLADLEHESHGGNGFVQDIANKFKLYGKLSDRQITVFNNAIKKDREYFEARKLEDQELKGFAPEGRQIVQGEVLGLKWQSSQYGDALKMLVKLDNNSKVYCSVPTQESDTDIALIAGDSPLEKGDFIELKATFSKNGDPHFAYGKRPIVKRIKK